MAVVSALAGAALLRVGLRVFAGAGVPAAQDPRFGSQDDQDQGDEEEPGAALGPGLLAAVLVAASLVWGVWPELGHAVTAAAARFTDAAGYAAMVLGGHAPAPKVPEVHPPGATAYLYAAATLAGAVVVALVGVTGRTLPGAVMRPVNGLRALHSGHAGDYVAWTAVGAVVLAGVSALTLR
jgi:multicomponent Na+:H+ antiporter subunit D